MARLKPTGSPTESARERARARRCYHPEDEYNPNHSGAVRGFDTDSLLSSIEQERSKTHGSGETERTGPAFVLRADDEGREVGVLRLPGAKKRGGQAGRRADAEGTRRVFGLVGHGEEQREEEVLAQRHVTFNDDNRLESPESSRLRVADPPDRGIFAGEDGEDHEYDEEEFEDDNEYSPTDYDYVVQQPEDSGPRTPSIGSSSSSTGQRSEAHDPSDRRSTLGAGRYSPHRPFTAMLGRWPSSSRSPSAQTPLDRSYRLPGHYPNSSPAPLSTVSHFSARRAAPGPVGRAGGRGKERAEIRRRTRRICLAALCLLSLTETRKAINSQLGRANEGDTAHDLSSAPQTTGRSVKEALPAERVAAPADHQHQDHHSRCASEPVAQLSVRGRAPAQEGTHFPHAWAQNPWSERRNAELEGLRAENDGLRLRNEELQQTLQELLESLSDEHEDEDDEVTAHGASLNDSDLEEFENGGFESWTPSPPSVYQSANTHLNASSSGRTRSRSNGGAEETQGSRRSSHASRRSSAQRTPPPSLVAQTASARPRRSTRISERDAKRAREAEDDVGDNNDEMPAKKKRRPSSKGKGKAKK